MKFAMVSPRTKVVTTVTSTLDANAVMVGSISSEGSLATVPCVTTTSFFSCRTTSSHHSGKGMDSRRPGGRAPMKRNVLGASERGYSSWGMLNCKKRSGLRHSASRMKRDVSVPPASFSLVTKASWLGPYSTACAFLFRMALRLRPSSELSGGKALLIGAVSILLSKRGDIPTEISPAGFNPGALNKGGKVPMKNASCNMITNSSGYKAFTSTKNFYTLPNWLTIYAIKKVTRA